MTSRSSSTGGRRASVRTPAAARRTACIAWTPRAPGSSWRARPGPSCPRDVSACFQADAQRRAPGRRTRASPDADAVLRSEVEGVTRLHVVRRVELVDVAHHTVAAELV